MADKPAGARTGLTRQAQLDRMAEALRSSAADADWALLGEQVRVLAPQLRALAAHGPWNAAERQACARLRAAHDAAQETAAAASSVLAARLQQLNSNKDGWLAYAMHSDTESGPSQL
jgi:hypothetical protein